VRATDDAITMVITANTEAVTISAVFLVQAMSILFSHDEFRTINF
jgi:hypothetical protein